MLSEERAIAELEDGIKMEKGDLDSFINRFEILVCHTHYNPNHSMVLRKFTDGLPLEMYKVIYGQERPPVGYQQWREAAIEQQRKWVHMRGCLDLFKTTKAKLQFPKPQWNNAHGSCQLPQDPNAMDTSPGQVKARVMEVSNSMPGGNRWPQSVNNPANRPNKFQPAKPREIICYCCGNPGHIAHNCSQKPPPNLRGPWVGQGSRCPQQGPSRTRRKETEEEEPSNVRAVCDNHPTEERAREWLSNVANEDEDVKNHILHQIMGSEQGF